MRRLRHLGRLVRDVGSYARLNQAWWLLPLVVVLVVAIAAGSATQTAVPYAVYTLF